MKVISKYFTTLIGCLCLIGFNSCEKQLEETSYSFYSPENFYKNESDAKAAINGVYNELYTYDLFIQPFWNLTILDDDHVSGADWYLGSSGSGNPQAYWGYDRPWAGCYVMIARANNVLENVGKMSNLDADLKNRILGEAYFLRAWAYFQLVQLYGGVPIRTESLSVSSPQTNIPRSTVKETYEVIIKDFKAAEEKLFPLGSPKAGEVGRVNQGLAKAFLAKVYLTMASGSLTGKISVRGGNDNGYYSYDKIVVSGLEGLNSIEYFTLARDKAAEVIASKTYTLTPSWKDLWSIAGRNSKEHMWQLQSLAGTAFVNNLGNYFSARSSFGQGAVWTTNNHYDDYEIEDKRVLDGITHNYTTLQGTNIFYPFSQSAIYKVVNGINYNNTNTTTGQRAYTIKFSGISDATVANSDAFYPLMRYSEVLLIHAEAENEINGGSIAAYESLALVRNRVNATAATAGMTKEQFRSFILAERAREFNLEGIRRFDLMRWGVYLPVMNKITAGQNNISKVRSLRNLLLPLPLNELNSNKAINGNNPGW